MSLRSGLGKQKVNFDREVENREEPRTTASTLCWSTDIIVYKVRDSEDAINILPCVLQRGWFAFCSLKLLKRPGRLFIDTRRYYLIPLITGTFLCYKSR